MPQDGCTSTPKVAGVMSPATPYRNTRQNKQIQGKTAQQDKLKDARDTIELHLSKDNYNKKSTTERHPTKLVARYPMIQKGQTATQGPTFSKNKKGKRKQHSILNNVKVHKETFKFNNAKVHQETFNLNNAKVHQETFNLNNAKVHQETFNFNNAKVHQMKRRSPYQTPHPPSRA